MDNPTQPCSQGAAGPCIIFGKFIILPDTLENATSGGHVVVGRGVVKDAGLVEDHGDEEADADADDDDVGEPRNLGEYEELPGPGP